MRISCERRRGLISCMWARSKGRADEQEVASTAPLLDWAPCGIKNEENGEYMAKRVITDGKKRVGPTLYTRADSYVQRVRVKGRRVERVLGKLAAMTLDEALMLSADNRRLAKEGINPWDAALEYERSLDMRIRVIEEEWGLTVRGSGREEVFELALKMFDGEDVMRGVVTIAQEDIVPSVTQLQRLAAKVEGAVAYRTFWTIEGGPNKERGHLNFAWGTGRSWGEGGPWYDHEVAGVKARLNGVSPLVGHTIVGIAKYKFRWLRYMTKEIPEKGEDVGDEVMWGVAAEGGS